MDIHKLIEVQNRASVFFTVWRRIQILKRRKKYFETVTVFGRPIQVDYNSGISGQYF
jgi:hypothetical protein